MATPLPDSFQGGSITFDSGFFAQITNISWSAITRESFATSHAGTTAGFAAGGKTYAPADLHDPGELSVDLLFEAQQDPPIDNAAETVTLTFNGGTTWAASGFMTSYEFTGASGEGADLMTATAVIKFSGAITITAN